MDSTFTSVQKALYNKAGIHLREDEKWPLLVQNIRPEELEGLSNGLDLGEDKWKKIYEILNISETYFYRDPNQLNAIVDFLLPQILRDKPKDSKLQVWSAGCSKGEEVYTLAVLLKLKLNELRRDVTLSVVGTDLQESSIEFARKGIYSTYSIRSNLSDRFLSFFKIDKEKVEVAADLRSMTHFFQRNLLEDPFGTYDLILCRNVLIYLGESAKKTILQHFSKALLPGGILVLGHSEYLGPVPDSLHHKNIPNQTSYFQKVVSLPKKEVDVLRPFSYALEKVEPDVLTVAPKSSEEPLSSLKQAREAKRDGKIEEAMSYYREALYENPETVEAYYELSNYYWENGDREKARSTQSQLFSLFKNDPSFAENLKGKDDWKEEYDEFLIHPL